MKRLLVFVFATLLLFGCVGELCAETTYFGNYHSGGSPSNYSHAHTERNVLGSNVFTCNVSGDLAVLAGWIYVFYNPTVRIAIYDANGDFVAEGSGAKTSTGGFGTYEKLEWTTFKNRAGDTITPAMTPQNYSVIMTQNVSEAGEYEYMAWWPSAPNFTFNTTATDYTAGGTAWPTTVAGISGEAEETGFYNPAIYYGVSVEGEAPSHRLGLLGVGK